MITRESLALSNAYHSPAGEWERLVAELFGEVFGVAPIGATDNFFDLGGDSLIAETLSLLISERSGTEFEISTLIDHGSPRQIANLLARGGKEKSPNVGGVAGSRPPIFIVPGRNGFILPPPAFRQAFAEGQELCLFELPGLHGGKCFSRLEDIAAAYVGELTQAYPEGPIFIAAFCVGGLIAVEMAAQLADRGRPVDQMVLLDPGTPKVRRVNIKRELKLRDGVKEKNRSAASVRLLLLLHRCRRLVRGLVAGKASTVDQELMLRNEVLRQRTEGRFKHPDLDVSVEARAKFLFALQDWQPRSFTGQVTVFSSRERNDSFRDPSYLWNRLLPQKEVELVFEKHTEVSGEHAARLVQAVFDEAVEKLGGLAESRLEADQLQVSFSSPHRSRNLQKSGARSAAQ